MEGEVARAGGTSDILARTLGERLQAALKQTVVVENKAGAGGVIGADAVAKSPPDGYTLLLGTIATHAINPALQPKMPYDAAKDFAPVWLIGSISNVLLVGADQPYRSAKDVIAAAKAKPGALVFGSPGQGTSQHLSGETLKIMAGIDIAHVPYKGSGPATQDLVAGQIPMTVDTALVALPHIQSGKIRALAVTSGKRTAAAAGAHARRSRREGRRCLLVAGHRRAARTAARCESQAARRHRRRTR